jgi:hypothetical protein
MLRSALSRFQHTDIGQADPIFGGNDAMGPMVTDNANCLLIGEPTNPTRSVDDTDAGASSLPGAATQGS